ncbi:ABC transporter ATP-binding protein [Oculatella sp. LEGE 06141]|uniref:ABC transporter ATP-binding protein n=1 Tax=Oculatella sp. LEGE 06141 TaxID=1828648 RepID=UPI00187EF1EA|nr:ABC transporter ATP-binding protein [Oculatella sp. LEGE 06141]MBE9181010.1 ABC transporter ATP-binding protein [Oculatella sp. LEGE 06141]
MTSASPVSKADDRRRDRQTDWRLLRILLPYAKRNKRWLLASMLLLVPLALATSVQPILIGQAISLIRDEPVAWFLEGRSMAAGLNILVILLTITVVVQLTFNGVQGYMVQKVGQHITADVRDDLFEHVTSLATRFFDRTPVGRLITRLTSDVDALGDVFSTGAIGIVSDLFSMVVITVIMFTLQWQLALMLLLMLFPITGLIVYFQQRYRRANYRAREELSALNSTLQENIVGINVVQLFRREQFNAELFRKINQRYITEVDKTIFFDSAVSATLEWIALVAIAGVLILGSLLVLQDSLNFGTLASFILFAQRLFDPLRQFAEKFTAIQAGLTALERVSDIITEPIEIRDPEMISGDRPSVMRAQEMAIGHDPSSNLPSAALDTPGDAVSTAATLLPNLQSAIPSSETPLPLPQAATVAKPSEIRFDHVWFGYKPDEYVLRDLDFTIRPGEKVALVGPTGAGKSSIIRLLCRLYEINEGHIWLDGVDVRDMAQAELRRRMAVILQDGFLFAGDIKGNISLGETYTLEQIRAAAEQTNVSSFIEQLPQGYDTLLRQRGTNLSGGQKQLLAFARAAIRNPSILVLDEATANLDVVTEAMIQQALERLLVGRTAIIIAHRLSTIRNVDRILVLKQGRLAESGSHEELLEQGGLYASLYRLQMLEG